jgi:hypothetical protein
MVDAAARLGEGDQGIRRSAMTLNETGACCDPFHIGCARQVTSGFSLPQSPMRRGRSPCQKCRYRQVKEKREGEGRPLRTGRYLKEAL